MIRNIARFITLGLVADLAFNNDCQCSVAEEESISSVEDIEQRYNECEKRVNAETLKEANSLCIGKVHYKEFAYATGYDYVKIVDDFQREVQEELSKCVSPLMAKGKAKLHYCELQKERAMQKLEGKKINSKNSYNQKNKNNGQKMAYR